MLEITLFLLISLLYIVLVVVVTLWAKRRNLLKNKELKPEEYLWKLKQISKKSEHELFRIAAEEKGWSDHWVEKHFRRYLEDQSLPNYVKEFIEDGKDYISAYRSNRFNLFDKKLLAFYSIFALLTIGGSFIFCLYIFPRIFPYGDLNIRSISKLARPHIFRAISLADIRDYEKACSELKRACELGECEYYDLKKKDGICQ